jgi:hypothetical protein
MLSVVQLQAHVLKALDKLFHFLLLILRHVIHVDLHCVMGAYLRRIHQHLTLVMQIRPIDMLKSVLIVKSHCRQCM